MRAAIAAAMARSKREIPHYYLEHQVDVTGCEEFLSRVNAGRPPDNRLLMGALAVKAVASSARRFPAFNGFHQDGQFKPSPGVHAGVAIAIRGGGLAAPAIHDSDQLTLDELMARMRDLIQPRASRSYPELGDGRFHDHRLQPWGTRGGDALRNHLSAASCDRGIWQGRRPPLDCRKRRRAAFRPSEHEPQCINHATSDTRSRASAVSSAAAYVRYGSLSGQNNTKNEKTPFN